VVASELGDRPDTRVITRADLEQMLELEVERQVTGCDDVSCLEELAGAIGAELVLYGRLEKLGASQLVSLNLFSQKDARSVARETAQGAADQMPSRLRAMIPRLFGDSEEAPEAAEQSNVGGWLAWGGGGTAVVGGATALVAYLSLTNAEAASATKETAFVASWVGIGVAVAGGVGLAVGATMMGGS
jgi:hypothetical protein